MEVYLIARLSSHNYPKKSLDSYAVSVDAPSTKEMQTQALFSGAQTGVIKIQNLVLPGASAPSFWFKSWFQQKETERYDLSLSPRTRRRTNFFQNCSSMRHFVKS